MATYDGQSRLEMPPTGRLHLNGGRLSADIHQQTSDYRVKHVTNSVSPLLALPNSLPFTTTIIDGQQNNTQYQKLEHADLSKKIFLDRQIKKAKSLAGLIKGTALSRHIPLQTDPVVSNPSTNNIHDDLYSAPVTNNDADSSLTRQNQEQTNETRRLRVSFSDFHKIQYFEGNNDVSQQSPHHRHRHRSARKSTAISGNNRVSPSSIQRSQTLNNTYHQVSRQQPIEHEFNTRKQQLMSSPRMTHLPDILNQPALTETSIYEKYFSQRDKPLLRIPEPAAEIPINSSTDLFPENIRASGVRPLLAQDFNDQNNKFETDDNSIRAPLSKSSTSSSLNSRHRPSLRTISLRQQFTSPIRSRTTSTSNSHQLITNPRRSASLTHSTTRMNSNDDDLDEINNHELLSAFGHRPMTDVSSSKELKRNYIIHFGSRNPFNGYTTTDSNETNHHSNKTNFPESLQERYRNVFKIVRSPYITSMNGSNRDANLQTPIKNTNGSIHSSRTNSGHGSSDFHAIPNTIFV